MANGPYFEKGKYLVEITDQGFNQAKTGTDQFVLRFKVLGKVDPHNPGDYIPEEVDYERTYYRAITSNTLPYFKDDLAVLGYTGHSLRELEKYTPGFYDMRGRQVEMICTHEPDQTGTLRERWSLNVGGGAMAIEPANPAQLRKLDALFGAQFKGSQPRAASPPPQQRQTAPATITDDDVPF